MASACFYFGPTVCRWNCKRLFISQKDGYQLTYKSHNSQNFEAFKNQASTSNRGRIFFYRGTQICLLLTHRRVHIQTNQVSHNKCTKINLALTSPTILASRTNSIHIHTNHCFVSHISTPPCSMNNCICPSSSYPQVDRSSAYVPFVAMHVWLHARGKSPPHLAYDISNFSLRFSKISKKWFSPRLHEAVEISRGYSAHITVLVFGVGRFLVME